METSTNVKMIAWAILALLLNDCVVNAKLECEVIVNTDRDQNPSMKKQYMAYLGYITKNRLKFVGPKYMRYEPHQNQFSTTLMIPVSGCDEFHNVKLSKYYPKNFEVFINYINVKCYGTSRYSNHKIASGRPKCSKIVPVNKFPGQYEQYYFALSKDEQPSTSNGIAGDIPQFQPLTGARSMEQLLDEPRFPANSYFDNDRSYENQFNKPQLRPPLFKQAPLQPIMGAKSMEDLSRNEPEFRNPSTNFNRQSPYGGANFNQATGNSVADKIRFFQNQG